MVNKMLDFTKSLKMERMVMKIDFERAYDYVTWDFLRYLFSKQNFSARWVKWMESLVFKG